MSRTINVEATVADITTLCDNMNIRISAIEALIGSGTHVVLATANDAVILRKKLGSKVLNGTVSRTIYARRFRGQ
jgi:hypothetical protein